MPGIFISYRREDTGGHAGRLYDHLSAHFGAERVFMDLDTIRPGDDFVQVISDKVAACDVLIALIGKQWEHILNARGHRRLDDPNDFVRIEIASALGRKVRVIPALIEGAIMPESGDLPEDLAPLSRRNAIEIRNSMFRQNVARLIQVIEETVGPRTNPGTLKAVQLPPATKEPLMPRPAAPTPSVEVPRTVPAQTLPPPQPPQTVPASQPPTAASGTGLMPKLGGLAAAFFFIQLVLPGQTSANFLDSVTDSPERLLAATLMECVALFFLLRIRSGPMELRAVPKITACWLAVGAFWLLADHFVVDPAVGIYGTGSLEFPVVLMEGCAALLFGFLVRMARPEIPWSAVYAVAAAWSLGRVGVWFFDFQLSPIAIRLVRDLYHAGIGASIGWLSRQALVRSK